MRRSWHWWNGSPATQRARRRLVAALALTSVCGFWTRGAIVQRPTHTLESEYRVDVWQTEDGLPQNSVPSIAQTPDGYLWMGTFNGVVRFDGTQFTVFDTANTPQLKSSRIATVHQDPERRLWITSEFGDLARWKNGRFTAMNGRYGLPAGIAFQECQDPDGNVWVWVGSGANTRFYRAQDGSFVPAPGTSEAVGSDAASLTADVQGRLWAHRGAGWVPIARTSLTKLPSPGATFGDIRVVGPSRSGGVWVGTSRGLWELDHGKWTARGVSPEELGGCTFVMEDREGDVWVGTWTQGLWRVDRAGFFHPFRLTTSRGPVAIRAAFQDREGNLWFGTDGAGLYRLKRKTFVTFDSDHGLSGDVVNAVTEDAGGTLWVLTQAGIDWIQPGPLAQPTHRFDVSVPWSVAGDRAGPVWIGTYGGSIYRYDGKGLVACLTEGPSAPRTCSVLFQDSQRSVWVGAQDGLWRVEEDRVRAVPKPPFVQRMDVRAMTEDKDGTLYVGLNGEGLLQRKGGQWVGYSRKDGLVDDHVWSLWVDADDTLWIGTSGNGLSCFRQGVFFNFPSELGLPRLVNCILGDDLGNLWLGSNQGIFRVRHQELRALAAGGRQPVSVIRYGKTDGLGTSECNGGRQPTVWKGRDGRLWFATVNGLSVVDPGQLPMNTNIPPVAIEEVRLNDVVAYPTAGIRRPDRSVPGDRFPEVEPTGHAETMAERSPSVVVPPGNQRLEIHYAALCFTAPSKVEFRYQLEPLDHEWTEAGNRRVAYYQSLPPGDYRFRVIACNNDGVWNETGASLSVQVLPLFWQTAWFGLTLVAVVAGAVWWVFHLRVSRLTRQRAQQEAFSRRLIESQELERKRIATELHDSLGQNLLVIKNRAVVARDRPNDRLSPSDQLDEISRVASETIEEVRQIAHNLRPYQLDRLGLTNAIRAAINQAAKSATLAIRAEIDPVDKLFPPELEINLYRIVQEGVNNIIKHAQAQTASVLLQRNETEIVLKIIDDGLGFRYQAGATSRWGLGLTGLTERIRILGGRLRIDSAPGHGTQLLMEIPLPKFAHES